MLQAWLSLTHHVLSVDNVVDCVELKHGEFNFTCCVKGAFVY